MSIYYLFSAVPWIVGVLLILGIGFPLMAKRKIVSPEKSEKSARFVETEIEKLAAQNIITAEQQTAIVNYYQGFAGKRAASRKNRLVKILAIFGVFLIGLGVILFIASNWRGIPNFILVLLLLAITFLAYYSGFRLKYRKAVHKNVGSALIILGGLLYGAALILTAQIYHIDIAFSYLMLIWALGILPVAFLDRSGILIDIALILTMIWGFASLAGVGNEQLTAQYYLSLPLLAMFALPFAYRFKTRHCLSLALLAGLIWLGPIAAIKWFVNSQEAVLSIGLLYLFLGAAIVCLGEAHRRFGQWQKFYAVYFPLGVAVAMVSTFVLTFPQVYDGAMESFMPVFFNFVFAAEIIAVIFLGLKRENEQFINVGVVAFGILVIARYFSVSWGLGSRSAVFIVGGIILLGAGFFLDKLRKKVIAKMKEE